MTAIKEKAEAIKEKANQLIEEANRDGIILTITLVPLEPLAMGNYAMVAEVSPKHPY